MQSVDSTGILIQKHNVPVNAQEVNTQTVEQNLVDWIQGVTDEMVSILGSFFNKLELRF